MSVRIATAMETDVPSTTPPPPATMASTTRLTNEQTILKEFILNLEALPELWDSSAKIYKDAIKRGEAYRKLLQIYKKINNDASVDDVKKKINSLRSNYRKELKKVVASKRSGAGTDEVYTPKSWLYNLLQFLSKTEQPISQSTSTVAQTSQSENDHEQEQHQEGNLEEQNSGAFSSINLPLPPPPKQKKKGPIAKQNELLDKACSLLSQPAPIPSPSIPMNATALYWSQKLEKLNPIQKLYAEKFINEILPEAELGNLGKNSVQINSPTQDSLVTPSPTPSPVYPVRNSTPSTNHSQYFYAPNSLIPSTVVSGVPSQVIISRSGHDNYVTLHHECQQEHAENDMNIGKQQGTDNITTPTLDDSQDSYTIGSLFSSFMAN